MAVARKIIGPERVTSIDVDFVRWCAEQAELLKARRVSEIDWPNIAEEIESMGGSQRRELIARYKVVCLHLLKLVYQPERQTGSWEATLIEQRSQIEGLVEQSPSLQPFCDEAFAKGYRMSRPRAALETDLPMATFPETPPFSREDAERFGFYPGRKKA